MNKLILLLGILFLLFGCSEEEPVEHVSPEEATKILTGLVDSRNSRENLNKAKQYIAMGADINAHSEYTGRPIIYIAYMNNEGQKFYNLLLEAGAIDFYEPTIKICELIENRIDDAEAVKEYIKQGAYVNSDDLIEGHSGSLFVSAIDSNMLSITKLLIQEGAGDPLDICFAIDNGLEEMTRLFLDFYEYSDEDFSNRLSSDLLTSALYYPNILQMLIDYGADPNFPMVTSTYWTALQKAMDPKFDYSKENKSVLEESIQILLDAGANPNRSPKIYSNEDTVIMQEAFRRYYSGESVGDINRLWSLDSTEDATSIDDYNLIIQKQNAGIRGGSTPVIMAIKIENPDIVRMLLEAKADPDRMGPADSVPPLMMAVYRNNLEIVDLLLEYGADPDTAEVEGGALALTVSRGYADIAEHLLRAGADPNIQRPGGATPLIDAVTLKNTDIVKSLMAAGADPAIPDGQGRTAIQIANELGLNDIISLMERSNAQ